MYFWRGEGREKERERNLSCAPYLGTWPTTQACALTRNRTSDPLVCRLAPNLLSHTSQGALFFYKGLYMHIISPLLKFYLFLFIDGGGFVVPLIYAFIG